MKGGAGTHIRGTIRGFEENGHQVLPLILGDMLNINMHDDQMAEKHLISTRSNSFKNLLPKFIRILFRDINTYIQSRKFAKRIISDAVHFNPDIIYERSCMFSNAGNYVFKNTNIPIFIETSGCLVEIFKESYGTTSVKWGHWANRKVTPNSNKYYKLFGSHAFPTKTMKKIDYPMIYIYRDGRAVAYSIWKTENFINPKYKNISFTDFLREKLDWKGSPAFRSKEKYTIAEHWEKHVIGWKKISKQNKNILIIRY
jgi:hypothetical protein